MMYPSYMYIRIRNFYRIECIATVLFFFFFCVEITSSMLRALLLPLPLQPLLLLRYYSTLDDVNDAKDCTRRSLTY